MTHFNLADLFESVAQTVPDRTAVIAGNKRVSYAQLNDRSNRLATLFLQNGIGAGDFVGIQLPNGNEYLEAMLAAFKVRAVPVNVNYRYVGSELRYLFSDAGLVGLVVHSNYADAALDALEVLDDVRFICQVGPNCNYESLLSSVAVNSSVETIDRSADDLYCVYTGGTTGFPKGVLWRHEDIFFAALGGGDHYQIGDHITEPKQLCQRIPETGMVALSTPPFMHASGHWLAFMMLFGGGTVVTLEGGIFDALATWELVDRERVNVLVVVGDAMARPLVEILESNSGRFDLSSLMALGSGGALFSPATKARFRSLLPNLIIRDAFGSSETGQVGGSAAMDNPNGPPQLKVDAITTVFDDDLSEVAPGSGVSGQLARSGHVPIGYLGDPIKTAETFVTVKYTRWVLPGDMATVDADGTINILGRASQCINTGGEKVYPDEVEAVLKSHHDVNDVLVVGVPDDTWGQAVCAVVSTNGSPTLTALQAHARNDLAGYKIPRHLVVVDTIVRSPSGKPDYRWAQEVAVAQLNANLTS